MGGVLGPFVLHVFTISLARPFTFITLIVGGLSYTRAMHKIQKASNE